MLILHYGAHYAFLLIKYFNIFRIIKCTKDISIKQMLQVGNMRQKQFCDFIGPTQKVEEVVLPQEVF